MQTLGNARDHFWRVIKMAKANRLNLSDALEDGAIDVEDYADIVTRCRGCENVGQCDRLLEARPVLAEAPEYCVNRKTFGRLKSR